uniref:Aftiphilin clathrin-binding box domain-containing protein n=1 Tax=Ditylenchus dipsaci TaxID=166011 RepID=A0A915D7X9_9BILA
MSANGESTNKTPVPDEIVEELSAESAAVVSLQSGEHFQEKPDEIEEGDDEFGDFEEAAPLAVPNEQELKAEDSVPCELNRPSCSRSISFDSQAQCNISDVISDSNLWVFDALALEAETTTINDSESVGHVINEVEVCDIFRKFDLCDDDLNDCLKDFELQSLRLWTLLCYVEETAALKFLWSRSFAYQLLLDALQMNVKKISVSGPLANSLPQLNASLTLSLNTDTAVADGMATFQHSLLPDASVDSLSVAPADFDWKTSGLMNPLTGASIGALSAVLECDFFSSDTNSNGQSILERDLQDMGLSNGHFISTSTQSFSNVLPVNLNQLMQNGQPTTSTTMSSPSCKQYKRVDELSLEAQALHNRLPDYSYMLSSNRLMFPLNHLHQHEQ